MTDVRGLAATWLTSRAVLAGVAGSAWYGDGTGAVRPVSDVELYGGYAARVLEGAVPYADVAIEYPLGSLPQVVLPEVVASTVPGVTYLTAFVVLAVLVDLLVLVALTRLARGTGAGIGPWAWVLGVPLLGPFVLLRLDLVPVAATAWAAERAGAGRWRGTGGLLVLGAGAKLWPGGLLPAAAVAAPRWRDVVRGAAVSGGVLLVASVGVLGPMLEAAVLRNLERGLQVETLWASLLLVGRAAGAVTAPVEYAFGADQVVGAAAEALTWVARPVPLVAVVAGAWAARRTPDLPPVERHARAAEVVTLVLVAAGSVLSAQFLLWALGATAVTAATSDTPRVRRRVLLVGAACVLTSVEFPWLYAAVKDADPGAVAVLVVRNLLLVAAAVGALRDVSRRGAPVDVPAPRRP